MSTRKWLPVVLKARQAAEDRAAQAVAAAQIAEQQAVAEAARESRRLDEMASLETGSAQVFLAAAAAQRAAAATHAAAFNRIGFAQRQVQVSIGDLQSAASNRRSAQKLIEREVEESGRVALSSAQRELDDLTVTRWGRNETA
jgi:hypothetical protein